MKFKVGDRVSRPVDVMRPNSPLKFGRILRRYSWTSPYGCGFYPELYDVLWDDGSEGGSFLPHGLTPYKDA